MNNKGNLTDERPPFLPMLIGTGFYSGLWPWGPGTTILGTWATARLQPYWGEDPSRVVVDEMVGVWIPLLVVQPKEWAWALAALVLFRFFDIVKPLGIKKLDRKTGAFWVMGDDILGGIYALVVMAVAKFILSVW